MTDPQKREYQRLKQAELVIEDLERLGILKRAISRRARNAADYLADAAFDACFLTPYGVSFIQAVSLHRRFAVPVRVLVYGLKRTQGTSPPVGNHARMLHFTP